MTEFHVEYRIEVDADSHEAAARKVAEILAGGGAGRGVYHVRTHPNRYSMHPEFDDTEVDLGAIDGTWTEASDDTDWVAEIDAVLAEVEESTEAGDLDDVLAARDAAAELLSRIRPLLAGETQRSEAAPADGNRVNGTLVWHVFLGPDSDGGMWLQQGPKTGDGRTPAGFDLVAYERPDKSCVDFITAASKHEAEAIYRAWLEEQGIEIP